MEGKNNKILEAFESMDIDQNGKISYNEFLAATIVDIDEEPLYKAFMYIDQDN